MSDTPRTDTENLKLGFHSVPVSFARELERENAKLRDALGAIRLSLVALGDDHVAKQCIETADLALKP